MEKGWEVVRGSGDKIHLGRCWPRVMCAVALEGGCWGTGAEEIQQLQPCEGSIRGWRAERADLPCPCSAGKLSDRWAVSPIAVNPSGDPIEGL